MKILLAPEYMPHSGQELVHQARSWADIIVLEVARRWGKTRGAFGDLMLVYEEALKERRNSSMIPPFHAWIIVPSFPQGRQIWHELQALLPPQIVHEIRQSDWMIWLKGNSNWGGRPGLIEIKSAAEPDSLQTVGLDYLWFNEAQDIDTAAHEKVWPTLRSPGRLGLVLAEGIPSLYDEHWFRRLFLLAKRKMGEGRGARYYAKNATAFDNPLLEREDYQAIEDDRDVLGAAAWERLYLAKFNASAGFFRNLEACISGDLLDGPIPGQTYVGGLDIGRANDPTVFHILDSDRRRIVFRREWDSTASWPSIHAELEQLYDDWAFRELVFDASSLGGKFVEEDLSRTALPLVPFAIVGERRAELLDRLAGALERATLSFPGTMTKLLRQLRAMQTYRMTSGKYRVQVPSGEHDDEIFALALALSACNEAPHANRVALGRPGQRYAPTQADVDGTAPSRSKGAQIMRKRASDRMRQRAEVAGITL